MVDMGMGLNDAPTARKWWPEGAILAADFQNNGYMQAENNVASGIFHDSYFTRPSSQYARDKSGVYHLFAVDKIARTDRGAELFGARSNLLKQSANIQDSTWTAEVGLTKSDLGIGPLPGQNNTRLTRTTGNGRVFQSGSWVGGKTYRVMAIVRGSPVNRYATFRTDIGDAGGVLRNYVFDLVSETIGFLGAGAADASITALPDDYYQIELDILCGSTKTSPLYFYMVDVAPTDDGFFAPVASSYYDVAYLDIQNGAGSYAPIVSGAVTASQAASVLIIPTLDFGLGASEGAMFWRGNVFGHKIGEYGRILELRATSNDRISFIRSIGNQGVVAIWSGGNAQATIVTGDDIVGRGDVTLAVTWGGGSARIKVGNDTVVADATVTAPTSLINISLGSADSGVNQTTALHKKMIVCGARLSDEAFDTIFAQVAG